MKPMKSDYLYSASSMYLVRGSLCVGLYGVKCCLITNEYVVPI